MEKMKYEYSKTTNKNTQNSLSKYKIGIYGLDQNSVFCYNFLNLSSWRFMKRTIESKSEQGGFSSIIVLYICGYPLTTSTPNGFGICIKEILFGFNFIFNLIFSYL